MRAGFKTVEYGKQVAVLVPTTVLAEQHERTFRERLADFPFEESDIAFLGGPDPAPGGTVLALSMVPTSRSWTASATRTSFSSV